MTVNEFRKKYKKLLELNRPNPIYVKAFKDYKKKKISSDKFWKIADKDANRHSRIEQRMEKLQNQFVREALKSL